MRLTLKDSGGDWWTIERAEHENAHWMERVDHNVFAFQYSGRISDADVEGTGEEMRAIAKAIRERGEVGFRRCAVDATGDEVHFFSPRNSTRDGIVSLADADALADEIEQRIARGM